jgi:hypothetical protein
VPRDEESDYVVPPYLTRAARRDFDRAVKDYAFGLAIQVERVGISSRKSGEEPEHNTDTVSTAIRIHHGTIGLQTDETNELPPVPAEQPAAEPSEEGVAEPAEEVEGNDGDWAIVAGILSTIATVGIGVMANYLHSYWQWGLFSAFIAIGLTGLGATWKAHRSVHRRRRRHR